MALFIRAVLHRVVQYLLPEGAKFHVDFLSGLTVSLALVPEAIAFSLVAGVNPLVGLFAAFFMCLITALIGGRPGMISGATGSMAVVYIAVVKQYGVEYLFATVILTGLLEILIGSLKFSKFIRILPKSVMVGFVNGLAIVIFIAQLNQFKVLDSTGAHHWLHGVSLYIMIALVLLAMIVTHFLPKITKDVPSALTAIIVVSLVVVFFHIPASVVQDMMSPADLSAHFPVWSLPQISYHVSTLISLLPYALVLSIIGLSESLMTLSLIDERTRTHGRGNRECVAQGVGNIVSGFFASMGGCAMIGQSMINITSGGRGRLSGIVAGVFLLLFILFLWPLIERIPLAALTGVMFMVVIETFEWATFKYIRKIPLNDAIIIVAVTVVTVLTNLAVAVVVGVIIASLEFAWQTAKDINAECVEVEPGVKEYKLHGPLFFGSSSNFKELFSFNDNADSIIIDFNDSRVVDHSAIDAIKYVVDQCVLSNKELHLRHVSPECKVLLGRAGNMVDVNVLEDPEYHVATDVLE
jgi:SulP family sulfate permease